MAGKAHNACNPLDSVRTRTLSPRVFYIFPKRTLIHHLASITVSCSLDSKFLSASIDSLQETYRVDPKSFDESCAGGGGSGGSRGDDCGLIVDFSAGQA